MKPFKYFPTRAEFRETRGFIQHSLAYKVYDWRDREEIAANAITEAMTDFDPNNVKKVPFRAWARMKVRYAYSNWLRCRKGQIGIDRMTDVVESVAEHIADDRGKTHTDYIDQLESRDMFESIVRALESHENGRQLARYWDARRQGFKPAEIAIQMGLSTTQVYNLGRQLKAMLLKLRGDRGDEEVCKSS